jgi:2-keto-3-deoxy-6-phosphogluconate aldolase
MAASYERDAKRVEAALRNKGIVVVMGRGHARNAQDVINTIKAIYEAGYVAEVTFRIPEEILKEAMSDLRKMRAETLESNPNDPMVLGIGSVINPHELETAIELGFDMIVGPDSGMGGFREKIDSVRITQEANIFHIPGTFSPSEFAYFLERDDGLEPNGIKIFNSSAYGPSGVGGLLAPYQRERHKGKIINPTGGVNAKTGAGFQEQILKYDFFPVLGMSYPLQLVADRKKPGDVDTLRESLQKFKEEFKPYTPD